jgi:3',5'-cyclic AMP phosphodiesterase CpdA
MINLAAIGDFGANTYIRNEIIKLLHSNSKLDAILGLGDNFYNEGVKSVSDDRWNEFEQSFNLQCPFYAVLGNHDYLGNISAQIEYSRSRQTFWTMPSRYYEKKIHFKDSTTDGVHIFFLDTMTICPAVSRGLIGNDQRFNRFTDEEQLRWLDAALQQSNFTWKIVVGHYPVFSSGLHGDTIEMKKYVYPILKKHKVNFYLSGHDHDLEYIYKDDINFIVSGTGCSSNPFLHTLKDSHFTSNMLQYGIEYLQFYQIHQCHNSPLGKVSLPK